MVRTPTWTMWGTGFPLLLRILTLLLLQHEDCADELENMGQFDGSTRLLLLLNKMENQPHSSLMMSQHGESADELQIMNHLDGSAHLALLLCFWFGLVVQCLYMKKVLKSWRTWIHLCLLTIVCPFLPVVSKSLTSKNSKKRF
jgi:hypothetical protein